MKITVIKQSNGKVKTMAAGCVWIIDDMAMSPKN